METTKGIAIESAANGNPTGTSPSVVPSIRELFISSRDSMLEEDDSLLVDWKIYKI